MPDPTKTHLPAPTHFRDPGEEADPRLLHPLPPPAPGLYLRHRNQGFAAHLSASAGAFRLLRGLTVKVLADYGADPEAAEAAQLVVSELAGNSVRACGDHVPLVVEVYVAVFGIAVNVHDPDPRVLPRPCGIALHDPEAESGRGLGLLDLLAPGWHVCRSPIGKQIRCRIPADCFV
ncbi:anti-sigma regulatory factor (Ser/Thr protein kinase) [Streptomyces sp. LBL]|uniref:ATP-binding protein n=1 Tax=Streptomyces sp. LBL TaxID=2940562 RepID=UPI002473AF80|nr:ATP-binding protein [Streptomyces sp. LBL]MDH6625275.1 anti-sigma regulatory factor (Ser/Thr protein kinase) [Streptomyces sp. LBL]